MKAELRRMVVTAAWLAVAANAQQYTISTVAGGGTQVTPVVATSASIGPSWHVAAGSTGDVYFTASHRVWKLATNGILTLLSGNGRPGYSGDTGPATTAQLNNPGGVALDRQGNLFVADTANNVIRRISTSGTITTVAGIVTFGASGDGGPATNAQLNSPESVAVDSQGNLFIADTFNNRIRKVSADGNIITVAGDGGFGNSGDGGPATRAQLRLPKGVTVDGQGNLFIADTGNDVVRKVSPDGIITPIAGSGTAGYSGDGGLATSAQLKNPSGVTLDNQGNLLIADYSNLRLRKVTPAGLITTVAGTGALGYSGDGGPATSARLYGPNDVALDGQGNIFLPDGFNYRIRKVSPAGVISTVAGNGTCCYAGEDGQATSTGLNSAYGVAVDGRGNLLIADQGNNVIRKVSTEGIITTVAGNGVLGHSGDGGVATSAQLSYPFGVTADGQGNIFFSETHWIRKISPNGIITTVAGSGVQGNSGDGGPAVSATLNNNGALTVDGRGNLFFIEGGTNRIRKVSQDGMITTVAGNGTYGFSGDGGPAASAQLSRPYSVAVDGQGNLLIADADNYRIRKVSLSGVITTVAGDGIPGYSGDDGPATNAHLLVPMGIAADTQGYLWIADTGNHRIRKISPGGIITTVAGNGGSGYTGDGGPATSAQLLNPTGVAVDELGTAYFADGGIAIRRLQPISSSVLISAVVDAASQKAGPVSPGKIVVIYGSNLGAASLVQNHPVNGVYPSQLDGTRVFFNGTAGPILHVSATQVAAIVPYAINGTSVQVTVSYQAEISAPINVPVAVAAPSLFTIDQTGAGQAAAINALDGSINAAESPVKIGGYISLFATGEGQTAPEGVDGKIASGSELPKPVQKVSVAVGGVPAVVQYAGAVPGQVAGLMQVNVQIPNAVQIGSYVPVVLKVGGIDSGSGAVWIAVAGN